MKNQKYLILYRDWVKPAIMIGTADSADQGTVLKQQIDQRTAYCPGESLKDSPTNQALGTKDRFREWLAACRT